MMSFFSKRTAALLVFIIWMVVIAVCSPVFFWFDVIRFSPTLQWCTTMGASSLSQATYSLIAQATLFYVPLAVTLASYFGIWYKMYFAKKKARKEIRASY